MDRTRPEHNTKPFAGTHRPAGTEQTKQSGAQNEPHETMQSDKSYPGYNQEQAYAGASMPIPYDGRRRNQQTCGQFT